MIRVLHIDDSIADLELFSLQLKRYSKNLEIASVQSASEAFAVLNERDVDCIVSDYQMPAMNGLQLLEELRLREFDTPFILLTGQGSETVAAEALRRGADDYLVKEAGFIHFQRFVHTIQRIVENHTLKLQQKQSRIALRESEEKFRNAFHTSPDSININRLSDGLYIDINEGFTRITGYSREEVIGKSSLEINIWIDPADRARLVTGLKRSGSVENLEAVFRAKDGTRMVGLMSAQTIMLNGEPHIISVTRDIGARKRVEETIRQNEFLFREMYENAPLAYQSLDENGNILHVNNAWLNQLGYSKKEVIGKSIGTFLASEDLPLLSERFPRFKATGEVHHALFHFVDKSGKTHLMEVNGRIGRDAEGNFLRTHCILSDKTEEDAANKALGLFRFVLEHAPDPVFLINNTGNITLANSAAARSLDYEPEELLKLSLIDFELNSRQKGWQAVWDRSLKERDFQIITKHERKDGTVFPVQVHVTVIEYEGEECICSFARDISLLIEREREIEKAADELEQMRHEVEKQKYFMDLMLDASPNFIFVKDERGRYVLANRAMAAAFQRTPAEMIGHTDVDLGHPSQDLETITRHDALILSGERDIVRYDLPLRQVDGAMRYYMVIKRPMHGPDGSIENIFGIAVDVTERRETENMLRRHRDDLEETGRLLRETNKELEMFSYTVSHDLQAPLRRIVQFIGLLMDELPDTLDDKVWDYLSRIKANSESMRDLISSLLAFSRITSCELKREKVDLSEMIGGMVQDYRQAHPDRHLNISIEDGVTVPGDPGLLRVVCQNILDNALKFTANRAEAVIEFGGRKEDGYTVCHLRDNGIGFDPAKSERLFQPFQRLHDEAQFKGSGIGLATVKRIIHRHGGTIWAESREGIGTTIFFAL